MAAQRSRRWGTTVALTVVCVLVCAVAFAGAVTVLMPSTRQRSTTAAAILTGLGFEHVSNLKGGMLDWNKNNLAVERGEAAR